MVQRCDIQALVTLYKSNGFLQKSNNKRFPVMLRRPPAVFLEKIRKMSHFFKAQGESDLGDVPLRLTQQYLSLPEDPASDDLAGRFSCYFFKHPVQMIDMHTQDPCESRRCP